MFYVTRIILVVLHFILLVTGSTGSLFILSVLYLDWMKTHQLNPIDYNIVCIVFANVFLQGSVSFNAICSFLFVEFYVQVWVVNSLSVIMTSLAFSSLWCSTTLCFYYYVKIINLNGTMFYRLKAKLPIMVPLLLVFSYAVSWVAGLPLYWDIYRPSLFKTANATYISSTYNLNFMSRCDCIFYIYIAFSSMAFSVILFTAGAIIKSLHKHMTRIKKTNEGLGRPRLSAHISAARTMTSLLVLYLIFYGALNASFTEVRDLEGVIFIVSFIVVCSFPTANAVILIFGYQKLINKLRCVLGVKLISASSEVSFTI